MRLSLSAVISPMGAAKTLRVSRGGHERIQTVRRHGRADEEWLVT